MLPQPAVLEGLGPGGAASRSLGSTGGSWRPAPVPGRRWRGLGGMAAGAGSRPRQHARGPQLRSMPWQQPRRPQPRSMLPLRQAWARRRLLLAPVSMSDGDPAMAPQQAESQPASSCCRRAALPPPRFAAACGGRPNSAAANSAAARQWASIASWGCRQPGHCCVCALGVSRASCCAAPLPHVLQGTVESP